MPLKPMSGLSPARRSKPKSRLQKRARSASSLRELRKLNLVKARRVRKKNLLAKKKASK